MLGAGTGYPYGSGEDTDYVLRACKARCTVVRAPGIFIAHPDVDLHSDTLQEKNGILCVWAHVSTQEAPFFALVPTC